MTMKLIANLNRYFCVFIVGVTMHLISFYTCSCYGYQQQRVVVITGCCGDEMTV